MNSFDEDDLVAQQAISPLDPGDFLAHQILREHCLTPPLSYEQVRNICNARGFPVIPWSDLEGKDAVCCVHPDYGAPVIFIKSNDPYVLSHELYHGVTSENADHGILYCMHWFAEPGEEDAANRFAWVLTSEPGEQPFGRYRDTWDEPGADE